MVRLAIGMAQPIRGVVHVQTNPYYSYCTQKMIDNAFSMFISITTKYTEY